MNTEIELPADVIAEIEANRKISAIKRLRAHQGIGLKDAKELVDGYIAAHPSSASHQLPGTESGIGRIVVMTIGVFVIYGVYKYFT